MIREWVGLFPWFRVGVFPRARDREGKIGPPFWRREGGWRKKGGRGSPWSGGMGGCHVWGGWGMMEVHCMEWGKGENAHRG